MSRPSSQSESSYTARLTLSSRRILLLVSVLMVGVLSGLAAWLLKLALSSIAQWLESGADFFGSRWFMLPMPLVGIMLAVVLCRYMLHRDLEHGTAHIREALRSGNSNLSPRIIVGSLVGNALTLGFGGSAGSESPMAYSGASIGSGVSRMFRLTSSESLMMVAVGAGAGIAAIFKSPVGGALFSIEVLGFSFSAYGMTLLFIGALVASLTAFMLSGCALDLALDTAQHFSLDMLWLPVVAGVFCGLYAAYYRFFLLHFQQWIMRLGSHWTRNILTGVLVSVLVFLFPSLYGEGYGVIARMLDGDIFALVSGDGANLFGNGTGGFLLMATGVILVKSIASSATNDGGGVAGEFAPALFAGAIAGFLFAGFLTWVVEVDVAFAPLALMSMAGVMAGALRAPLMAVFLVVEMSGQFSLLLPVAIVVGLSYVIASLLGK